MCSRPSCRSLALLLAVVLSDSLAAAGPKGESDKEMLPEGAVALLGGMRLREEQYVTAAAFSADGKVLRTVSDGSFITEWDPATGKRLRRVTVKKPAGGGQVRFTADGAMLVIGGFDGIIRLFDTATGEEKQTLTPKQRQFLRAMEISGDGKTMVTALNNTVAVWDVTAGSVTHELEELKNMPLQLGQFALTPDGKQLVLPQKDGSLHLVETATGKEIRAIETPVPRPGMPRNVRVQRIYMSPDGHYVALASFAGPLTLCDLTTGKRLRELGNQVNTTGGVAFTPNSRFVAVNTFQGLYLYGVLSGKELRRLPVPFGFSNLLVFAPDGQTAAMVGAGYRIHLLDVVAGRELHPAEGHAVGPQALVFFDDGKRLASCAADGRLLVWDITTSRPVGRRDVYLYANTLSLADDGRTLQFLTTNRAVQHWDPAGDRFDEGAPLPPAAASIINQPVLSPDGQSLASTAIDRKIYLQNLKKGATPHVLTQVQQFNALMRFSPDSRLLLTTDADQVLRLWDRTTGKAVRELKPEGPGRGMPSQAAFAPDARSLAVYDGQLRLREVATGDDRLTLAVPGVTALALSPEGRLLARGQPDGSVVVHGTSTGRELASLHGPQGSIMSLAFSRDGRLLASGGANGTILVWKMPDGEGLPTTLKPDDARALWQALGDVSAGRGSRAIAGLVAAPEQAIPLIKERFRGKRAKPTAAQLARLIADLDADAFKVRERATRELAELGPDAVEALRKALDADPSAEVKERIEGLLKQADKVKGGAAEHLRALRAVEVLERIGTPAARDLLRELMRRPLPPELEEEIDDSLHRLGERR
jgi:WD40 repeat protein